MGAALSEAVTASRVGRQNWVGATSRVRATIPALRRVHRSRRIVGPCSASSVARLGTKLIACAPSIFAAFVVGFVVSELRSTSRRLRKHIAAI